MTIEQEKNVPNGWLMLPIALVLLLGGVALTILGAVGFQTPRHSVATLVIVGIVAILAGVLLAPGFFTLQPNEARVLILFGAYKGTARKPGFHWANPFFSNGPAQSGTAARTSRKQAAQDGGQKSTRGEHRYKVSLRARTLNMDRLKVNDKRGNPIEIAAVVVWNVKDTAQAIFDVDDFSTYVATQSETALRHLASAYAYDHGETSDEEGDDEVTLRSNVEQVSDALRAELEERLVQAGVTVQQARLSHLAYSPEIAQAMLRRQQAEAVIAARRKIVTGAVSMVEMALHDLSEKHVVDLDEERKAAMVSNLMVVLCGEAEVHPVVNTGTLYT
jgi:regulator of protease activity HflC (stomatin/prohibitin superfamily)